MADSDHSSDTDMCTGATGTQFSTDLNRFFCNPTTAIFSFIHDQYQK